MAQLLMLIAFRENYGNGHRLMPDSLRSCARCGACWVNGQHRWLNGNRPGNELDLAGLVCNRVNDPACINPARGQIGGQTWEGRGIAVTAALAAHGISPTPVAHAAP